MTVNNKKMFRKVLSETENVILRIAVRSDTFLTLRGTCKIAAKLDDVLVQKLEKNELKPRKHPGIVKSSPELPSQISHALLRIIRDYPIKSILQDGKKLNQYIASRHPPVEHSEAKKKVRSAVAEINELMPPLELSTLSEEDGLQWRRKREQAIKRILGQRTYAWKPINYGQYEAVVYAIIRGAREYAILKQLLSELQTRDPEFNPRSYFDFGSGVGTGMWAASSLWKDSIFEYYNVDSSRDMNDLAELILSGGNENQQSMFKNVYFRQFLPAIDTKYDLVISSFSLFELPGQRAREDILLNLWQKCDGYLMIVEEGSRRGSELVNESRQFLLGLQDELLKGHVFAPCAHDLPCPRLSNLNDNTPCNFEASYVPLNVGSESRINKLTARYSYVILKKGNSIQDSTREWPRLVRPTLARSGHIICRMCTANAKLQEVIFTQSKHGRLAYRCAKSSRWGDRLPMQIGKPFESEAEAEILPKKRKPNEAMEDGLNA